MRYLLDSNLIVYPFDPKDPGKQAAARATLDTLIEGDETVLSSQTLAEFASVTLRKLRLPNEQVYRQVERYERLFPVYPVTPSVVLEAVRGVGAYQLAYYDAQIWAAAKLNQVPVVLSEDFSSGSSLEGVMFLNPLAEGFALDTL